MRMLQIQINTRLSEIDHCYFMFQFQWKRSSIGKNKTKNDKKVIV